jgi:hypothetical protein
MVLFLSEMRMGVGDELEDFLLWGEAPAGPPDRAAAMRELHERFTLFMSLRLLDAQRAGLRPRLVLLGNTFNLWQVQRPGEPPARALARILDVHQPVVAALRHWCDAGGELDVVPGSHDQPLVDARAWALLRERLPAINATSGRVPAHALADAAMGLYAEHGHQHDPACGARHLHRPQAGGSLRHVTRSLLSSLEPLEPWIDKALITSGLLLTIHNLVMSEVRDGADASLLRGMAALAVLRRILAATRHRSDNPARARLVAAARAMALGGSERALVPLPPALRFVVLGHPASPARVDVGNGVELLAPAPWRAMAMLCDGRPVMQQQLGYAMLVPDGAGGWEASVRQFAAELAMSS